MHRKKTRSLLSWYSWDNIAQVNSLCNVVQETPANIAQEKFLFIIVLILLGLHCTGKIHVQCCPRGFRQHCMDKILVQCCPRGSRQYCTGKKPVQCCLNTLGTTLHSQKPCVTSKRLLTQFYRKKLGDFYFRSVNVSIITTCL